MALTNMLDWVVPQTIETVVSPFNGEIRVVKFQGRINLWSGGAEQSGELVQKIWRNALLRGLTSDNQKNVQSVLILGLGGGSIISVVRNILPNITKIVGIEIDPVIVELGKKYYGLSEITDLEIVLKDADSFLDTKKPEKFDLILLDVYRGGQISQFYSDPRLKSFLNPKGVLCVNVLDFYNKNVHLEELPGYRLLKKVKTDYSIFFFLEVV